MGREDDGKRGLSLISSNFQERLEKEKEKKQENKKTLSGRPQANADVVPERLAEEAFSGLHLAVVFVEEFKVAEDGGDDALEFHLGDVAADAGARARGEGDEGVLLPGRQALLVPAVGDEVVGVRAPDLLGVVDRVARHADGRAGGDAVAQDLEGLGVRVVWGGARDETREAERAGAVDAHRLVDHGLHVREILDLLVARYAGADGRVQLLLQFLQNTRRPDNVVQKGTSGVRGSI